MDYSSNKVIAESGGNCANMDGSGDGPCLFYVDYSPWKKYLILSCFLF